MGNKVVCKLHAHQNRGNESVLPVNTRIQATDFHVLGNYIPLWKILYKTWRVATKYCHSSIQNAKLIEVLENCHAMIKAKMGGVFVHHIHRYFYVLLLLLVLTTQPGMHLSGNSQSKLFPGLPLYWLNLQITHPFTFLQHALLWLEFIQLSDVVMNYFLFRWRWVNFSLHRPRRGVSFKPTW